MIKIKGVFLVLAAVCLLCPKANAIIGQSASKALSHSNIVRGNSVSNATNVTRSNTEKKATSDSAAEIERRSSARRASFTTSSQQNTSNSSNEKIIARQPQKHLVNMTAVKTKIISMNLNDEVQVLLPSDETYTNKWSIRMVASPKYDTASSSDCIYPVSSVLEQGTSAKGGVRKVTLRYVPGNFIRKTTDTCQISFMAAKDDENGLIRFLTIKNRGPVTQDVLWNSFKISNDGAQ